MRRRSIRPSLALALSFLALLAGTAIRLRSTSVTTEAHFINVGQGDAILLRDGNGFDVLVDGGKPSAGPTVLAYLRDQGISDIDVMVATHGDADHIGGLIEVLEANDIPVLQVLYNGYPGSTATWANFATAVANEGMTPAPAQYPAEFVWGGLTAYVLNPVPGLVDPEQNNASVVLLVRHGSIEYLLTGDIDSTAEAQVVARGTPVAAEILKVGHHGSASSSGSDFLAAVGAAEAVIQVGTNPYGHPTVSAINRLIAAGAEVWRTDIAGTITVISDGTSYSIQGGAYLVFMPLVLSQPSPTATPTVTVPGPTETEPQPANLSITTLSGSTTPEYVIISNNGGTSQNMTGWYLVSAIGPQTFNFPGGFTLGPGAQVRIESYIGAVNNPPAILLWSTGPIWNNAGDRAELYNSGNGLVDSECYAAGCP